MNITVGCLIEYYTAQRELVAFQQPVLIGNVFRAMWFYQSTAHKKSSIWFHAVRFAIDRVISDQRLRYVDLGPSYNDSVKKMKAKFLFEPMTDWRDVCDYSGDFRSFL